MQGENMYMCHTLNTIVRGFVGGMETSFSCRRYARQLLSVEGSPASSDLGENKTMDSRITFSEKDSTSIHPRDNDPMVITVKCDHWEINKVVINHLSYVNILYSDTIERLHLDLDDLITF